MTTLLEVIIDCIKKIFTSLFRIRIETVLKTILQMKSKKYLEKRNTRQTDSSVLSSELIENFNFSS